MNLTTTLSRGFGRGKLLLVKHAPGLMTYGGIAVIGVGIFLFCKASMRLDEVVNDHDNEVDAIHTQAEEENWTDKETKKALFHEGRHFAWDLTKLYGPAFSTTLVGFSLILGGHHIIKKRNAALGAAYKALENLYNRYRANVREDLGEEKDREYLYGLKKTKETELITDENGEEKAVSKDIYVVDNKEPSIYARFFDEYSTQWTRNPEYNLMFLNSQQGYANDKLHAQGHLFLNEVYEMLGLPHTQVGSVVGWVLNKDGDNCVDFGIYDLRDKMRRAFVNGYEPSILLDFNVDGPIYDLI